jgi:hypothetical protein
VFEPVSDELIGHSIFAPIPVMHVKPMDNRNQHDGRENEIDDFHFDSVL